MRGSKDVVLPVYGKIFGAHKANENMNCELKHVECFIDKDDLTKNLNKSQLRQLIMITAIFRDLTFAEKIVLQIKNNNSDNEVLTHAKSVNRWAALILLIGKICAACEFIEKDLNKNKVELTDDLITQYDNIIKIYGGKTYDSKKEVKDKRVRLLFAHIRNKYGAHYGRYSDVEEGLSGIVKDLPEIKMWLCTTNGNDIFFFASAAEIGEALEFMKKQGFNGAVKIGKSVFSGVIDDVNLLWLELIKNGYINEDGVIQEEFVRLSCREQMRVENRYSDKQRNDMYFRLKYMGLYNELVSIAANLSGKLDAFFKEYLGKIILKGIRVEEKRTVRTKVPSVSESNMPVLLDFQPEVDGG